MRYLIEFLVQRLLKIKQIFSFTPHDTSTTNGKSNERFRRILITGGATAISKVVAAALNLLTIPMTVSYLGAERYGLWVTISSILVLLTFADFGLGNGLINAVSKANGRGDIKSSQFAVSTTFFILLSIALCLFLIFILCYPFVSWKELLNIKSALAVSESGPSVFVMITILLLNLPLGVIQKVQDGHQEGYKYQIWLLIGTIISFLGLLICIYFKLGLVILVLVFSGGQVIATIANGVIMFGWKRKYLRPSLLYFNWQVGKELLNSGAIFFLLVVFTLLANYSDNLIIAKYLGLVFVPGYEVVRKLFVFSMFTQFLIQPLWPAFAEALEGGDITWAKKTLNKGLVYSIIIGAISTIPLVVFGKQIIELWVGKEFTPGWILLIGYYFFVIISNYGGVMSTFLNTGPLLSKQLIIVCISAIASIILKILLVQLIGVGGVVWATVIGYSVFFIVPSYMISIRYLNSLIN